MRLRFGLETPVRLAIAYRLDKADRDVDPDVVVVAACLEQQHLDARISTEPVREDAAGAAGADHDVIKVAE